MRLFKWQLVNWLYVQLAYCAEVWCSICSWGNRFLCNRHCSKCGVQIALVQLTWKAERERDSSATGEQLERQSQWRSRFCRRRRRRRWMDGPSDQHNPAKTSPAAASPRLWFAGKKLSSPSRGQLTRRPLSECDISSLSRARDGRLGAPLKNGCLVGNLFLGHLFLQVVIQATRPTVVWDNI